MFKKRKPYKSRVFSGDDVVLPNVSFSVVNNYSFTGLVRFSNLTK